MSIATKSVHPFHGDGYSTPGMTLREWYAGLALQGLLASPDRAASIKGYARDAVAFADALIAELETTA